MYTAIQRLNNISAFSTTIIITLISLISFTSFLIPIKLQPASLRLGNINVKLTRSKHYYNTKPTEYVDAKFDLVADLSPLFHWNTKQVFIYLKADYSTPNHPTNSVVIWDRILRNKKYSKINIAGGKQKYEFKEISDSFKNVSVIYSLNYDLMPHVGLLKSGQVVKSDLIKLPSLGSKGYK